MAKILSIDVPDLPEDFTPLEVMAVAKCLDEQGRLSLVVRSSDGLMAWEAVGMLIAAADTQRADLQRDFIDERTEFDDDEQIPEGD